MAEILIAVGTGIAVTLRILPGLVPASALSGTGSSPTRISYREAPQAAGAAGS